MPTYTVQNCGCIALPEDLQEKTGLHPGAKFEFEVARDGSSVKLTSIQRTPPTKFKSGAAGRTQDDPR